MNGKRRTLELAGVALLSVGALFIAWSAMAGDCYPDLDARLDGEEAVGELTHLQFTVDISTNETCATIEYDLIIEIQLENGHVKKVRKPRRVKLSDGSLTEYVRHEMSNTSRMVEYEVKLVDCSSC
jgi:hypothetical protein